MTDVVGRDEAISRLRHGAVVAVPTDTVYGLAASLEHPEAVAALFRVKRRPSSVALPVLVHGPREIESLGVEWPERARLLSEAWWPGALTIVVPVARELASKVGGVATAGFRVPDDPMLLSVLEECGPLAVSSANEHGEPPCRNAAEILASLGTNVLLDAVLDDGERAGDVSSVVEISGDSWRLLRAGQVSVEEIARLLD